MTRATRERILVLMVAVFLVRDAMSQEIPPVGSEEFNRDYDWTLTRFVNDQSLVDYDGLKQDRARLDRFLGQLGQVSSAHLSGLTPAEQIAFWINAYNAFTLKAIIDNYPIRSGFFSSLLYPKNSIRQIDGVWDKLRFRVAGRDLTLDEMEHSILRKDFSEPRIHMALVCAAMSCPPLRRESYVGLRLDEQLTDQTRQFLRRPENFRIDRSGTVYLSAIFDWFGSDFESGNGPGEQFAGRSRSIAAVLTFILTNVQDVEVRQVLESNNFRVKFLDYDWTLNSEE